MKIVFFGSDDFAAVHLQALLAQGYEVAGCITGPDRAQGRGMKVIVPPIKKIALENKVPCLQPVSLKDKFFVDELKDFKAEIFVVVAYGRLLTQEVLDIPRWLCMNVHGSLLPKYRGAAPVNWAILNGDQETGVTVQKMVLALDAGDIISQEGMRINEGENSQQLRGRMALTGADLLIKTLQKSPGGDFPLRTQDLNLVTWAPKLTKEMGRIDWRKPVLTIVNQVRGLQPWPGAYTYYQGKMLKITQAQVSTHNKDGFLPGQVVNAGKDGLSVACADGVVLIKEVQPESGRPMTAYSFVAGLRGEAPLSF